MTERLVDQLVWLVEEQPMENLGEDLEEDPQVDRPDLAKEHHPDAD